MRRNPESCVARALRAQGDLAKREAAQKAAAARAAAEARRSALLREHSVLASWRGGFEEAARRFLLCAAKGGAFHADAAAWLAGLSEGVVVSGWDVQRAATLMVAETEALEAVGSIRRVPRTPAELDALLTAAWPVAVARDGRTEGYNGPANGFDRWNGQLTPPEGKSYLGGEVADAGFVWNAGGRSTPGLRPLADGRWEVLVAVPRWYLEGDSTALNAVGGYCSMGAPLPRSQWDWRCEPLRS